MNYTNVVLVLAFFVMLGAIYILQAANSYTEEIVASE